MEEKGDEPETIDVWELMKDLDEDENCPNMKQPSAVSLSKQANTVAKISLDAFTLEPPDVKEVPPWLSSFQTHGILGRSIASHAECSSRELPTYGKARSKHGSIGGSTSRTSDLMVKVKPTQETLAEHLQKSLSFEMPPKKEMKRGFGQKDAMDTYHSKGLKLACDTGASGFSSNRLPWEGESVSSPSTPTFAGSVSLNKWFQEDACRSKNRQEQRAALSGHEAQSRLPPYQVIPPLMHPSKVLGPISKVPRSSHNMQSNVDAGVDHKSESAHEGAHQMLSVGLNQTPQQGHGRRLRHSFTAGNRNMELMKAVNSPANNRSSSLELEKFAAVPNVRIVFYSTSSKVDAHTFEDSNAARAILTSIVGATFEERSISQSPEYEQELKSALNTQSALIPTVFVKGRYITGLDNIMQLYKKGLLRSLLVESLAQELKPNAPCICRGGKFLICPVCKGKRKLVRKEGDEDVLMCRHCSATGLIKCPNCLNL